MDGAVGGQADNPADDIYLNPQPGTSGVAKPPSEDILEQFDPLASGDQSDADLQRELERLALVMEQYLFDQSHRPKLNDIVSFFDPQIKEWIRIRIIGTQT